MKTRVGFILALFLLAGVAYATQEGGAAIGSHSFTVITVNNTGLHVLDTGGDHDLIIAPGTDLGADRQLTITTGDAARGITLADDLSVSAGAGTLDQDVSAAADDVTFDSMNMANGSLRLPVGTDLPATCTVGDTFLDSNDDSCADSNDGSGCLCICIATNTWGAAT